MPAASRSRWSIPAPLQSFPHVVRASVCRRHRRDDVRGPGLPSFGRSNLRAAARIARLHMCLRPRLKRPRLERVVGQGRLTLKRGSAGLNPRKYDPDEDEKDMVEAIRKRTPVGQITRKRRFLDHNLRRSLGWFSFLKK